jgi:pimeloyl-ACP methyl ester carboxylesterase
MIEVNGVELCAEAFGQRADPPILLVMGMGGSMLWWEEGFCRMLAQRGRFVIRYDHRDTGPHVEPGVAHRFGDRVGVGLPEVGQHDVLAGADAPKPTRPLTRPVPRHPRCSSGCGGRTGTCASATRIRLAVILQSRSDDGDKSV